ncbi:Starch-binding associating with outer membrane [Catalinimonas alkaloidigena]|uniref:Starch-binding associating with outer membrane n=1 Tax=Catalinimonas alkaloidigena TaxID=1075417 RepID=A0A1G9NGU4_9BACT|nr:SusD/RagB family nutrient-binding outer membrane lipoprotein [Catalinimonas alkaloidigena]SDL85580.1 Starch-binding associating with outer membrane [Catalinimonas alkaloidigena]
MKRYTFPLLLTALLAVTSCKDFEDLQVNPNNPTQAPPSQIFTGVLYDWYNADYEPWSETQRLNQFYAITFDYYGNQDYNWSSTGLNYGTLRNVLQMEKEAERLGDNSYAGLASLMKAYFFIRMTERVGDIPMRQALQGLDENYTPQYDTQKEVYLQCLDLLEQANTQLAAVADQMVAGDIFMGGSLRKWQQVSNALYLRTLISLSHQADDADLRVKERFAAIINNPSTYPLMQSLDDNATMKFFNVPNNQYPINPSNRGFTIGRYVMGATYLDFLKMYNDPRLFVVAEPTDSAKASGDPDYATKLTSYVGAPSGATLGDLYTNSDAGKYSLPKDDRYYTYTGEPTIIVGYAEQEFTLAEGIARGWASGDAAQHYTNGITASMNFYGITDPVVLDAYLSQDGVAYAGNGDAGLIQILTQKYLAFFQNSGWEAFYNQRRTGVPTFDIGPGNQNGGRIPERWQYPQSEYRNNEANLRDALQRQFGGADDINRPLWILE